MGSKNYRRGVSHAFAGVAHDVNNLMAMILAGCEEILLMPDLHESMRQRVHDIHLAAASAASLTRQVVGRSQEERSHPRVIDLNQIVTETRGMLGTLITGAIDLDVRPGPQRSNVLVDPAQMQRVLINLAVNARDAMPNGGRLLIETRNVGRDHEDVATHGQIPSADYVLLVVTDTGTGMNEYTLARIFEPFFSTKPMGQGTGLGLSIVYGIVKQTGGFIRAESEPGRGSTFKIYLPRVEAARPALAAVDGATVRASGQTVLLVDDNHTVREMTRAYLTRLHYHVLAASNATEALTVCADLESPPDLLITDIVMPGTSGLSLAAQVRRNLPQLRVLFVSGYADAACGRRESLPQDAHFLPKPFVLRELATKIREILEQ